MNPEAIQIRKRIVGAMFSATTNSVFYFLSTVQGAKHLNFENYSHNSANTIWDSSNKQFSLFKLKHKNLNK